MTWTWTRKQFVVDGYRGVLIVERVVDTATDQIVPLDGVVAPWRWTARHGLTRMTSQGVARTEQEAENRAEAAFIALQRIADIEHGGDLSDAPTACDPREHRVHLDCPREPDTKEDA